MYFMGGGGLLLCLRSYFRPSAVIYWLVDHKVRAAAAAATTTDALQGLPNAPKILVAFSDIHSARYHK